MDFRLRLLGISLAGGLAATVACTTSDPEIHVNYAPDAADGLDGGDFPETSCNASPDPCCADPDGAACLDAGTEDAASDAPHDAPDDAADSASDAPHD